MHHPNIIQTYTYTVKPTGSAHAGAPRLENAGAAAGAAAAAAGAAAGAADGGARGSGGPSSGGGAQDANGATGATPSSGGGGDPSSSGAGGRGAGAGAGGAGAGAGGGSGGFDGDAHTLNFEVSLVLEFADRGSLRDALDAGAFALDGPGATAGGVNYAAVLDTAADVARAMLHLHSQSVLHADLKARNVLLKTDAQDARGAVAKGALCLRVLLAFRAHLALFRTHTPTQLLSLYTPL